MSYEDEMYEYHDDIQERCINKPYLIFRESNTISCRNISLKKIVWEYLLWILAGKPDNHKAIEEG